MKRLIYIATILVVTAVSCQKLQYPPRSSDCTLSGLKCFVYYDTSDPYARQELNLLSGTWNKERGLISFVFPSDSRFTNEALMHCRIEATIPSSAVLELLDESGNGLGHGFDGFYDLRDTTLYFTIVAADGTTQSFQLTCKKK
ncbi:MAG: hypothetical protein SPL17_06835 [Bacteroidales bacterium]|nr:hypothetical protein [Bacteroidales bacterium]MDY6378386.1 hypothetical protein [Bacteroidales bacterium]